MYGRDFQNNSTLHTADADIEEPITDETLRDLARFYADEMSWAETTIAAITPFVETLS